MRLHIVPNCLAFDHAYKMFDGKTVWVESCLPLRVVWSHDVRLQKPPRTDSSRIIQQVPVISQCNQHFFHGHLEEAAEYLMIAFDRGIDDPTVHVDAIAHPLKPKPLRKIFTPRQGSPDGYDFVPHLPARLTERRCPVQPRVPLGLPNKSRFQLQHQQRLIERADQIDFAGQLIIIGNPVQHDAKPTRLEQGAKPLLDAPCFEPGLPASRPETPKIINCGRAVVLQAEHPRQLDEFGAAGVGSRGRGAVSTQPPGSHEPRATPGPLPDPAAESDASGFTRPGPRWFTAPRVACLGTAP